MHVSINEHVNLEMKLIKGKSRSFLKKNYTNYLIVSESSKLLFT